MTKWPLKTLAGVATVGSGSGFPIVDQGSMEGQFPFLKVSDMNLEGNARSIQRWNNTVTEEVRQRLRATAFPAGSVIFPKIGAAIATNKKRLLVRPSCVDNNVMAIVARERVLDSEFLYFLLLAKDLSDFASDSNPPSIRKSVVEAWNIPVPPLSAQRQIVDFLSRAEGIVRLRREAQKKAAEIVPALFLDMFGDPATNLKQWETRSLSNVLVGSKLGLVRGAKEMGDNKAYPYLRMNAVSNGRIRLHGLKRIDASRTEVRDFSLRAGDFLFNTRNSRELVGKTGLVTDTPQEPTLFNNNLMRMRFDENVVLPAFINWQFQTVHIQRQLESIKRGTTTVFAIYCKDLKDVSLVIPELGLQRVFSDRVAQLTSVESLQQDAIGRAEATFQALLARFFVGSPRSEISAMAREVFAE